MPAKYDEQNPQALRRLIASGTNLRPFPRSVMEAAEKAKVELSSVAQTQVSLPFITADATGPKHLTTTVRRSVLDEITHDLVERTMEPVRQEIEGRLNQVEERLPAQAKDVVKSARALAKETEQTVRRAVGAA